MKRNKIPLSKVVGLFVITSFFLLSLKAKSQTTFNFTANQPTQMIVKFEVEYKPDRVSFKFTDSTTTNPVAWHWDFGDGNTASTQNTIHTYSQKGQYTICLAARNPENCRDTTCVEVDSYLGLDNLDLVKNSVKISPNPFDSDLNIQLFLEDKSQLSIKLFNMIGEEVLIVAEGNYQGGLNNFSIEADDVEYLKSGFYFIQFNLNGQIFTEKVIRN